VCDWLARLLGSLLGGDGFGGGVVGGGDGEGSLRGGRLVGWSGWWVLVMMRCVVWLPSFVRMLYFSVAMGVTFGWGVSLRRFAILVAVDCMMCFLLHTVFLVGFEGHEWGAVRLCDGRSERAKPSPVCGFVSCRLSLRCGAVCFGFTGRDV
jgi:hypothetical protein